MNISQKICDYVAVSDVYQWSDILDRIITQYVVDRHPLTVKLSDAKSYVEKCGLENIAAEEIADSLDRLVIKGSIFKTLTSEEYCANGSAISEISSLLTKSRELESKVKAQWYQELAAQGNDLDETLLWECLMDFFVGVIDQHGLSTLEVVGVNGNHSALGDFSMGEILDISARKFALDHEFTKLRDAILSFFSSIEFDQPRGKFVAELAQGAFAWQSIHVPKDVATKLAGSQKPLTLLFDTNFLIDLVGLSTEEEVNAARNVFELLKECHLEIKFRYLPETEAEFIRVISAAKAKISQGQMSRPVARGLQKLGALQGIEAAYARAKAVKPIRPEDFFLKYLNPREIFKGFGLAIYQARIEPTLELRGLLSSDFTTYLTSRNADGKPGREYEAIEHDSSLLAHAILQRASGGSLLEAKMLILSRDRKLSKFDIVNSRRMSRYGVVLTPQVSLQMIRPFIPSDTYSKTLLGSVIRLEFRSLMPAGLGDEAHQRAISLLSSVEDLDEDYAVKLLSDRALMRGLEHSKSSDQAIEMIQVAASKEAASLKFDLDVLKREFQDIEEKLSDARERAEREKKYREVAEKAALNTLGGTRELESKIESGSDELENVRNQLKRSARRVTILKWLLAAVVGFAFYRWLWVHASLSDVFSNATSAKLAISVSFAGVIGFIIDPKDYKYWIGTILLPLVLSLLTLVK